jgi:hypothetical protein
VQDTWRATPDLTLNVGLRYEHNPFFNGINGQTSAFDSSNGKIIVPMHNGQLLDPNAQPEIPLLLPLFSDRIEGTDSLGLPQSIRKTGPGQFAPRFGLAYNIGGSNKFVARAAYGLFPIYLDTNLALQWVKVPPFEITQTINNATGTPSFNWANPFNGQSLLKCRETSPWISRTSATGPSTGSSSLSRITFPFPQRAPFRLAAPFRSGDSFHSASPTARPTTTRCR